MFLPMNRGKKEVVKYMGTLEIIPDGSVTPSTRAKKIVYKTGGRIAAYHSIFSCNLLEGDHNYFVSDIRICKDAEDISEQLQHMFLGWLLESAEKWAEENGSNRLVVKTRLSHCTEWFVELGFTIFKSRLIEGANSFRGVKKLK